jgi:hypothetical protein
MDNKLIVKIQKQWLLRRLKGTDVVTNTSDVFKLLDTLSDRNHADNIRSNAFISDSDFLAQRFDKLTKQLIVKKNIQNVDLFLNRFYRYYKQDNDVAQKLNARKLLTLYAFVGFPEIVLSKDKSDLDNTDKFSGSYEADIYFIALELRNKIRDLEYILTNAESLRKFIKLMNIYSNIFNMFLNVDKIKKVDQLMQEWYQNDKTIEQIAQSEKYSEEQKEESINVIKGTQTKVVDLIKTVSPKFNEKHLTLYKELTNKLEFNLKKGFWDLLENDLKEEKYDNLMSIINEIKTGLIQLNRTNITEYDEKLDIEFMRQLIQNKLLTPEALLGYTQYIVEKIIELQAPVRNEETENKWEEVKFRETETYETKIVEILKFILERIEEIKDDILNVKLMADFGISVLKL